MHCRLGRDVSEKLIEIGETLPLMGDAARRKAIFESLYKLLHIYVDILFGL
jgi:hypothetical protein